jgi:hypothetical protein
VREADRRNVIERSEGAEQGHSTRECLSRPALVHPPTAKQNRPRPIGHLPPEDHEDIRKSSNRGKDDLRRISRIPQSSDSCASSNDLALKRIAIDPNVEAFTVLAHIVRLTCSQQLYFG